MSTITKFHLRYASAVLLHSKEESSDDEDSSDEEFRCCVPQCYRNQYRRTRYGTFVLPPKTRTTSLYLTFRDWLM